MTASFAPASLSLGERVRVRAAAPCVLVALLAAVSAGCGSQTFKKSEGFDPRVPLRVAVLPFVDRSTGDNLVSKPFTGALDLVPVLSDDSLAKQNAATIMRINFAENLRRTPLDVVDLHVVDSILARRKIQALPAYEGNRVGEARRLGAALGVDAVCFGEVLEWDRQYYVVESVAFAGLKIQLRETTTGAILFESEVRDTEASGVSKLPIATDAAGAAAALIVEPIKGLRISVLGQLADDISRQIVEGLVPSAEARAAAKAPRIHFVAHSSQGALGPGDRLIVVAIGDPGARATFRLSGGLPELPMSESAPGCYQGSFTLSKSHILKNESVTVRLVSRELLASTFTVARPPIRSISAGAKVKPR